MVTNTNKSNSITVPLKPRLTIERSSSFTKLPNAEDRKMLLERSFIYSTSQRLFKKGGEE